MSMLPSPYSRLAPLLAMLAILSLTVLMVWAAGSAYSVLDLEIARRMQRFDAGWFGALMAWVSVPGFAPQQWIMTGGVALWLYARGLRWEAIMLLFAAIGAAVAGNLVKILVHRPRPAGDLIHVTRELAGYSFPSGHVVFYTVFFGFLLFLGYTLFRPCFARSALLCALGTMIVLVGPSRVVLGGHWPSDVLGGYLLGGLWLLLSITLYRRGKASGNHLPVDEPISQE